MAINSWLLASIITNDHIVPERNYCWQREDLVSIPAMIQYEKFEDEASGMIIFMNNIGCNIVMFPYGLFDSPDSMLKDYYGEGKTAYQAAYKCMLNTFFGITNFRIKDFDWVMPLFEGKQQFNVNYCSIPNVLTENKDLISILDCSFIYSCTKFISSFVSAFNDKKLLSKYEQYQLAYYQSSVQSIEKPECFLTNAEEIGIYKKLYLTWGISLSIENAKDNISQAVMMFSFLSNYKETHNQNLFSSFLTFFGIVVGLEAIYNLAVALMGGATKSFNLIYLCMIGVIILIYLVVFTRKTLYHLAEGKEFKIKTKEVNLLREKFK